jgi:PTH1 family peptidyl-tRNA hydrolase
MRQKNIIILMGLGNPGHPYENTRHNIGFRIVDALQRQYQFSPWKKVEKYDAFIAKGVIADKKVLLAKPSTFMNNSGKSAKKLVASNRLSAENLWVIHDDFSLSLGTIRIVKNRGSAGHHGVNSIIEALGTKDFIRLRVGTGKKIIGDAKEFVLQKFSAKEEKILKNVIAEALAAMDLALKERLSVAMTEYNKAKAGA